MLPERSLSSQDVQTWLFTLVCEVLGLPVDSAYEDFSISEDLNIESAALMEVLVTVEEEFDVELDPVRVIELDRLGLIAAYVGDAAVGRQ